MRGLKEFVYLVGMALASSANLAAQEPPELVTDRPDQTESTEVVPRGAVQLEVGALVAHDEEGRFEADTFELPGLLVRVGLIDDRLELRLGWQGVVDLDAGIDGVGSFRTDGGGDGELGLKIRLAGERGARPAMAVLVSTSVPVGEDPFTSERYDPAIRFAFAHTLSERLDLSYNAGAFWESEELAHETTTLSRLFYTIALGIGLDERWGAFIELFGDGGGSAGGPPAHSFDGGFTYLVRDNLQLDAFVGTGLTDAADDWFAGIGLSVRWPR